MKRSRGRPRNPSLDQAILAAARVVIAERGVTGATMEEIAKTAGVGKDTLYRRWPTKERLAVDMVDALARDAVRPAPVDPDPRLNLLLYIKDIVRLNERTDFGGLIAGLVSEAVRNAELAACFGSFWQRRRSVAAALVRDVVGVSVEADELEVLLDRLLGPIYYRLLVTQSPVTDEFLWNLINELPWSTESGTEPWDSDLVSSTPTSEPASAGLVTAPNL